MNKPTKLRMMPYWKVFSLSMGSDHCELVDPKGKTRRKGDGEKMQKIADERNSKLGIRLEFECPLCRGYGDVPPYIAKTHNIPATPGLLGALFECPRCVVRV